MTIFIFARKNTTVGIWKMMPMPSSIFVYRPKTSLELRHEAQVRRVEAREEHHHERERDVVIERRAAEEAERREQHERDREPLLVRVQPGRDEHPDLIHDERRGEHDAGDQRDL